MPALHSSAHRQPQQIQGERAGGRIVDVEKARSHFNRRARLERVNARARGVPLIAGYYVGALIVAAAIAAAVLWGVRFG